VKRSLSVVVVLAVVVVAVVACSGSESATKTPSGARASCAADADCEVTNFAGCCACCESTAHAVPVLALSQQRSHCGVKECAACSTNIACASIERAEGYVARCKDGTCAAVRR
jgi:hypothetical protein